MTNKINCPICSNSEVIPFLHYQKRVIYLCRNCTVRFTYPVPSGKELKEFYKEGYYEGETGGVGGYKDYISLERNLEKEAFLKLAFMQKIVNKGKLLDIGSGTGVFAKISENAGFKVSANDISPFAGDALDKKGIEFFAGPVDKKILPEQSFDVVTAWDVIEHMADAGTMLEAVKHTLVMNGLLFLTTPDTGSWDARVLGKKWYGYKKLPEHLLFFDRRSITYALEKHGFETVDIKNWGFYRSLGYISDRIKSYGKGFSIIERLINLFYLNNLSFFFPMTDFMVVGRKRN